MRGECGGSPQFPPSGTPCSRGPCAAMNNLRRGSSLDSLLPANSLAGSVPCLSQGTCPLMDFITGTVGCNTQQRLSQSPLPREACPSSLLLGSGGQG